MFVEKEKHPSSHLNVILQDENCICDATLFCERGQGGNEENGFTELRKSSNSCPLSEKRVARENL